MMIRYERVRINIYVRPVPIVARWGSCDSSDALELAWHPWLGPIWNEFGRIFRDLGLYLLNQRAAARTWPCLRETI